MSKSTSLGFVLYLATLPALAGCMSSEAAKEAQREDSTRPMDVGSAAPSSPRSSGVDQPAEVRELDTGAPADGR